MLRYAALIGLAFFVAAGSKPTVEDALAAPTAHHRCHRRRDACRRTRGRSSTPLANSVSSHAQPMTPAVAATTPEAEVSFDTDGSEPQPALTAAELEVLAAEGERPDVIEEVDVPG
jgi:hypothetical protein